MEWSLIVGPGARMPDLRAFLVPARDGGDRARMQALEDLDELRELEGRGRLLLAGDELAAEDVGLLRRFLRREPGFELVLVGTDPSRRAVRSLLAEGRARWVYWPPDVDDLIALARPPGERREAAEEFVARAPSAVQPEREPVSDALVEELSQIEAILGGPSALSPAPVPSAPLAAVATNSKQHARAITSAAAGPERAPAGYFRDQVADLADLAQTIELGVATLREGAQDSPEAAAAVAAPLDALGLDVARLLQFTRTLGYQVAPPAPGQQAFELGELVELCVQGLVARGDAAPRCLWRRNLAAHVRSDKQLLSQAFDALFYVAGHAAARGEIVRVQLRAAPGAAHAVQVVIEFPAGPLAGLEPGRMLEPYALRRALPELGPNALLAAGGIVRGQGGELELVARGEKLLEWVVTLPLAPPGAGVAGASARAARAEDPFA